MKVSDKNFRDWFQNAIGYGYGTGEEHTTEALSRFMHCLLDDGNYDYVVLENSLGGAVTWLLISILCRHDIIEYGTSPRFGFLTPRGKLLRDFVISHSVDTLYNIVTEGDEDACYPDACNCGGYEEGKKCKNPLWR